MGLEKNQTIENKVAPVHVMSLPDLALDQVVLAPFLGATTKDKGTGAG
jgi:hypothetical protein